MFLETFIQRWFQTHSWRRFLVGALGLLLLPTFVFSFVVYGASMSGQQLGTRYLELVEADVEKSLAITQGQREATEEDKDALSRMQVPLRRLLQIGDFNDKVVYVVAVELVRQGRVAMAAQLMREIAPRDQQGFPAAHAWLANYELMPEAGARDLKQVKQDLEAAVTGGAELPPALLQLHISILSDSGEGERALDILRDMDKRDDLGMYVLYAELARRMDKKRDFKIATTEGREVAQQRIDEGSATLDSVIALIRFAMLDDDVVQALALAETAFKREPQNASARRLFSHALLAKHVQLLGDSMNPLDELQYLDAAVKIDPANPQVMEQLAKAGAAGGRLPAKSVAILERSLVDGSATALTHLVIGNHWLARDRPEKAISHLRISLRALPNSPVVMNNLAYAILQIEPDSLAEAEELVANALRIPNMPKEMVASVLDTQGQLRQRQGDAVGAIESYEKAIQLDSSKVSTRERMVEVYRGMGMESMASLQEERIVELKAEQAQNAETSTE